MGPRAMVASKKLLLYYFSTMTEVPCPKDGSAHCAQTETHMQHPRKQAADHVTQVDFLFSSMIASVDVQLQVHAPLWQGLQQLP